MKLNLYATYSYQSTGIRIKSAMQYQPRDILNVADFIYILPLKLSVIYDLGVTEPIDR